MPKSVIFLRVNCKYESGESISFPTSQKIYTLSFHLEKNVLIFSIPHLLKRHREEGVHEEDRFAGDFIAKRTINKEITASLSWIRRKTKAKANERVRVVGTTIATVDRTTKENEKKEKKGRMKEVATSILFAGKGE
ncbi:uncharacterized protein [Euphorbia lathyris]|uniref:uncharacterized protein n=1 Tax=Euphorbia lathyris TaxID=212925 RepID=UPI003313759F